MRKVAAAVLAVPVLAVVYVPILLRRKFAARIGVVVGVVAVVGAGAFRLAVPDAIVATAPQDPIVPLSSAAFRTTVEADRALDAPITIAFSAAMDPASVEASLEVEPPTAVRLAWDETGTRLTITPRTSWAAGTYHTISVLPGALGQSGRPMAVPARAAFLTRPATAGRIEATALVDGAATIDSSFRITFDGRVEAAAVRRALRVTPAVEGRLETISAPAGASAFVFTPTTRLAPGTAYTVSAEGLVDAEGMPLAEPPILTVTTTKAPRVVRFRPLHRASGVDRAADLSVRFTESMDRRSAKAAFVASTGGKPLKGTISFAERDTVLVFDPAEPLPWGAEVELLVRGTATSAGGAPLAAASSVRFKVEARPQPAATTRAAGGGGSSGGGAVGGGSWAAVETYYLGLMNCTRTGGLVTSSGACSSPGGRNVAPLSLDAGISSKVARPYAKLLATRGQCSHFIGGNPGDRLRRAGYTSYVWAENLGCRSGNPKAAVLGSHLYFQSERSWSPPGGHYVNLMNAKYDRVGIGVWVSGGRVRLVVDFYHPL